MFYKFLANDFSVFSYKALGETFEKMKLFPSALEAYSKGLEKTAQGNLFYQKIESYAKKHVEATNRGHEYLEGEKIQHFWHAHCEFCWEKALTDKVCTFYCTEDLQYWICEECFRDFKEKFHWTEKPAEELFDHA